MSDTVVNNRGQGQPIRAPGFPLRSAASMLLSPALGQAKSVASPFGRINVDAPRPQTSTALVPAKRPLEFQPTTNPRLPSPRTEEIDPSSQDHPVDENRNPRQSRTGSRTEASDTPESTSKRPRKSTDSGYADIKPIIKVDIAISDSEDEAPMYNGQIQASQMEEPRGGETQMEQESLAVSHGSPPRRTTYQSPPQTISRQQGTHFNDKSDNIEDWCLDKLRTELQAETDRILHIVEQILEILTNGGGKSSEGNNVGFLNHTKSYVDERVAELRAEISRREAEGRTAQPPSRTGSSAHIQAIERPTSIGHVSSSTRGSSQSSVTVAAMRTREPQFAAQVQASESLGKSAYFRPSSVSKAVPSPAVKPRAVDTATPLRCRYTSDNNQPPPQQSTSRLARRPESIAQAPSPRFNPAPISAPRAALLASVSKGKERAIIDYQQYADDFSGIDFDEPYLETQENGQMEMRDQEEKLQKVVAPVRQIRRSPPLIAAPIRKVPPPAPLAVVKKISPVIVKTVSAVAKPAPIRSTPIAEKQIAPPKTTGTKETDPARVSSAPKLTHPWSRDVAKALRQRFGLAGFRQNQEDAVNATLSGKDVFVLLPTGGGKSLCFQLPAVVQSGTTKGVTIVVSPLLSLISDQCKTLIEKDIPVIFINGQMSAADRSFALSMLTAEPPTTCLAYVTPELVVNSGQFRGILSGLYRRKQLARFVIDEAHCVSSWGHDFRPDYKQMSCLKKDYPGIPLIALTATANDRVKRDVLDNLGMCDSLVLTQSFNRPNLKYEVRPKTKKVVEDIATFIKKNHGGQCGIIYCHSKAKCEETADKLRREHHIQARHYHAGMNKDDRARIQTGWQTGEFSVICATIAFGMGIDKADVRYVVHFSLSGSLEAYYQETGRAGRDGKTSICVLFYTYADTRSITHLIDQGEGTREQKDYNRDNLKRVVQYCSNQTDCRRAQVLQYFGEKFPKEKCHKTCDNCLRGEVFEYRDITADAMNALELAASLEHEKGITVALCVGILRGSKIKKIVERGFDQSEWHGSAAKMDLGDVERLFQLLLNEDVLGERFETVGAGHTHSYVITGKRRQELLSGKLKLKMAFSDSKKAAVAKAKALRDAPIQEEETGEEEEGQMFGDGDNDVDGDDVHTRCCRELMALRKTWALKKKMAPSEYIRDDTIEVASLMLPINSREWLALDGADDASMEWYLVSGAAAVCIRYAAESGKAVPASAPVKNTVASSSAKTKAPPKKAIAKLGAKAKAPPKPRASTSKAVKAINLEKFRFKDGTSGKGVGIQAMPIRRK